MKANLELFKNAISHEVKSVAFYDKAAEMTGNDEARMLFLELSDMEYEHIRKLLKNAENVEWSEKFDPEAYCSEIEMSIAKGFSEEESKVIESGDMKAILQMVIKHEENTRQNYFDLAENVCSLEEKEFCQELYDDEGYHVGTLRNLLLSLEMDDEDRPPL